MLTFTTFLETRVVFSAATDHEVFNSDDRIILGANLTIAFPLLQRGCNFPWKLDNKPASNNNAWPISRFKHLMVTAGRAYNSAPTND